MTERDRCTCQEAGDTAPEHTCPYAEEINDDFETTCICCPFCTGQCQDDI